MTNYICINGQKAELTEEQLKALGIELPKANPFERVNKCTPYYLITGEGKVSEQFDIRSEYDNGAFDSANYCTDKALMKQRALHETLNRLLWRYSMEHDGDKVDWYRCSSSKLNYRIYYNHYNNRFEIETNNCHEALGTVYFYTKEIALNAIKEIIKPFMAAHPDFKF